MSGDNTNILLPNGPISGAWQIYVLAGLYLVFGIFTLYKLVQSNRLLGYKACIYLVTSAYMLYKGVIHILPIVWSRGVTLGIAGFGIPIILLYVSYSVLPVYLIKLYLRITVKEQWEKLVNIIYWSILGIVSLAIVPISISAQDNYDVSFGLYSSMLFGTLVVGQCVGSIFIKRSLVLMSLTERKVQKAKRINRTIKLYTCLFVIRIVWNISQYVQSNLITTITHYKTDNLTAYYSIYFAYYCFIDIMPLSVFIILLDYIMFHKEYDVI